MEDNRSGGNSHGSDEGPLRRRESWVGGLQRLVDALIIIGAQALAHAIYSEPWSERTMTTTVIALLVFGLAAEVGGLYRPWRTGTILAENKDALIAWLAVPVALFAFWFFTKTASHYSRIVRCASGLAPSCEFFAFEAATFGAWVSWGAPRTQSA